MTRRSTLIAALALTVGMAASGCATLPDGVHDLGDDEVLLIPAGSSIIAADGERLTVRRLDGDLRIGCFVPKRSLVALTKDLAVQIIRAEEEIEP